MSATTHHHQAGHHHEAGRAIALVVLAFALYSGMDTTVKFLTERYPVWEVTLGNAVFGLIPLLLWMNKQGGRVQLKTQRLSLHLARGLCVSVNVMAAFTAYSLMPLADAYAIAFSSPIFIMLLSVVFLGEHAGPRRWTAVAIGFVGVVIMLRPGAQIVSPGALFAVAGTAGYAGSVIIARRLRETETLCATILYSQLVLIVLAGLACLMQFRMPDLTDLAFVAGAGLLYGTASLCFFSAVRLAPVAIVTPFQYTQMLWGTLAGYLIWHQFPDMWVAAGGAIVITSGAYILHRETKMARLAQLGTA